MKKNKFKIGTKVKFTEFDLNPRHNGGLIAVVGRIEAFVFDPGLDMYDYRIVVHVGGRAKVFCKPENALLIAKNQPECIEEVK